MGWGRGGILFYILSVSLSHTHTHTHTHTELDNKSSTKYVYKENYIQNIPSGEKSTNKENQTSVLPCPWVLKSGPKFEPKVHVQIVVQVINADLNKHVHTKERRGKGIKQKHKGIANKTVVITKSKQKKKNLHEDLCLFLTSNSSRNMY